MADAFVRIETGAADIRDAVLDLLAEDVVLWSDGGGKVAAALNPIRGAPKVARFFVGLAGKAPPGFISRIALVNGLPGVVNYIDGRPQSVAAAEIGDGKIRGIRIVVNPDKLQQVPRLPTDDENG